MLVARSFSTKASTRREKEMPDLWTSQPRKDIRGFGWRPTGYTSQDVPRPNAVDAAGISTTTERVSTISLEPEQQSARPPPSKPVSVPQHSRALDSEPRPHNRRSSSSQGGRSQQLTDAPNVSPPVAAMLASTAIPPRKTFPRRRPLQSTTRRVSSEDLAKEWKSFEKEENLSLGTSPAMQILLAPPIEESEEDLVEQTIEMTMQSDDEEEEEEVEEDAFGPIRSASDLSMPSMDADSQSGASYSLPSTPGSGPHRDRRKVRALSSPKSVDCGPEHPLSQGLAAAKADSANVTPGSPPARLNSYPKIESATDRMHDSAGRRTKQVARKPSSFRSSLTASLNTFRTNISRTFSNFSAPANVVPDDQLLRGFLGTPYTPEMRPRPISGVPDPKLRRYLNPHAFQLYDFHLHNSHVSDADHELNAAVSAAGLEAVAASASDRPQWPADGVDAIPMQPYQERPAGRAARKEAVTTEAGRAREAANQQQRREPRENPEFLRIAVLELQMRRAGKGQGGRIAGMGATMGRRGWWLPPRTLEKEDKVADLRPKKDGVPLRWQSTTLE